MIRTSLFLSGLLLALPSFAQTPIEIPDTIAPSSQPAPSLNIPPANPTPVVTPKEAGASVLRTAVETYEAWLRRYDNRFIDLEDRIAKTSQALDSLEFEALGDVGVRSDAVVSHYASPGAYFLLEEIRYQLDGVPILSKLDSSGSLGQSERFNVFSGRITPGKHIISVEMVFRVRGFDLLSSELRGARFRAKANYVFESKDGIISTIEVVGKDTSTDKPAGLTVSQVEKRFKVSFTFKEVKGKTADTPTTPASTPASSSSSPATSPK